MMAFTTKTVVKNWHGRGCGNRYIGLEMGIGDGTSKEKKIPVSEKGEAGLVEEGEATGAKGGFHKMANIVAKDCVRS